MTDLNFPLLILKQLQKKLSRVKISSKLRLDWEKVNTHRKNESSELEGGVS